jgi:hypothetical protein
MTLKKLFGVLFVAVLFVGCSPDPLDVDVSGVDISIKFHDAHSKLYKANSSELKSADVLYRQEIPELYDYFLGACIGFPENTDDSLFLVGMQRFQQDSIMKLFEKAVDKEFSDLKPIENKLIDGFKHLKYHLPNGKFPDDIVFINLTLKASVFCTENEIGIGLERYLGPKSKLVKQLDNRFWYNWVKAGMDRKYLERDVLAGWIETHVIEESDGNLAERIIRSVKVLYLTKAAFPEMEDHLIMRYSKQGWDWAVKNEFSFWDYLVQQKLLFDTKELSVMNMINPGPTTPGLPEKGGPDRMGQFLGYRMVKNYVELKELKLKDLADVSYNDILQEYEIEE